MSDQNQNFTPSPGSYPGKGMSIAAMVLGILAMVVGWIPGVGWLGLPCAIVALILGIIGRKKAKEVGAPTGMATAGVVLAIISLGVTVLATICIVCLAGAFLAELGAW